jgi:hypothetical protein
MSQVMSQSLYRWMSDKTKFKEALVALVTVNLPKISNPNSKIFKNIKAGLS